MSKVEQFLNKYENREGTRRTYSSAITKFTSCIYGVKIESKRTTIAEKTKLLNLADKYIDDPKRNHYDDLMQFASSLNESPPKTAKTYMTAVKEFLSHYGIDFKRRQLKDIKLRMPKGNSARSIEMDMEKETIRQIMEHLDTKGTALILTLASSGMRIGEALQIELDDMNLDNKPARITIRGEYTKSGENRITYISNEAKITLLEWLKVRKTYIKNSMNKKYGAKKDIDSKKVFPFSDAVVYQMWTNALQKTCLDLVDGRTGRTQLRIHQLRKYFRSQLAIGCPVDIVEALMGHEGYLTDAYRRYSNKQMAEHYSKHEHLLYISAPKDLQRIEEEFKAELQTNSKFMHQISSEQQTKIRNLEDQLENISSINIREQIEDAMEDLIIDNETYKNEIRSLKEEIMLIKDSIIKTMPI